MSAVHTNHFHLAVGRLNLSNCARNFGRGFKHQDRLPAFLTTPAFVVLAGDERSEGLCGNSKNIFGHGDSVMVGEVALSILSRQSPFFAQRLHKLPAELTE